MVPSQSNIANAAATAESRILTHLPTVAEAPTEVKAQLLTDGPANVSEPEDSTSNWFWLLLEHAGYERW